MGHAGRLAAKFVPGSGCRPLALLFLLASVAAAGCRATISGDIRIDGVPFVPTICRSGEPFGFVGVELSDADGRVLIMNLEREQRPKWGPRPARPWSGTPRVTIATPETGRTGFEQCGSLIVRDQESKVIYRNVAGEAALGCGSAHRIEGRVQFENCH